MSTITAANTIQRSNPPLEYSKKAIREHLQHHATNGPAYVQIQATNALARMIGLYEDAKQGITNAAETAVEKAKSPFHGLKFNGWGGYAKAVAEAKAEAEEQSGDEDEEAANQDDDDVP